MNLIADLELNELSRVMDRYVRDLGIDPVVIVRDQTRLILETLIRITPPHGLSQGRKSVQRAVNKIFNAVDTREFRAVWVEDGTLRIVPLAPKKAGERRTSAIPFPDYLKPGDLAAYHHARINDKGKVTKARIKNVVGQKRGALPYMGLVKRSDFKRYLRTTQSHVGTSKGAFVPGLHAVGGSAAGWIERSGGKGGETHDVHLADGERDPRLTIINRARGMHCLSDGDIVKTVHIRGLAAEKRLNLLLKLRADAHFGA